MPSQNHAALGCSATVPAAPYVIEPATAETLLQPQLASWKRFLEIWQKLTDARGAFPARSQIDPVELGTRLLSNVFIMNVFPEADRIAPRFRVRLAGQAILDRTRIRAGDYLDEIASGADLLEITRHFLDAIRGILRLRYASVAWTDRYHTNHSYAAMILPLADNGKDVTHLIGFAAVIGS